jgi:hypothetical protein
MDVRNVTCYFLVAVVVVFRGLAATTDFPTFDFVATSLAVAARAQRRIFTGFSESGAKVTSTLLDRLWMG